MNLVAAIMDRRPALRAGRLAVANLAMAIMAVAVLFALAFPASAANDQVDADDIIRTFAPIDKLFDYAERRLSVELDVRFELGSARLTAPAQGQLDKLAEALRSDELRDQRFLIVGHTDASGPAEQNKWLSQRRAEAVKAYLAGRHHIAPARLEILGLGEEKLRNPMAPDSAENRRVEIIMLTVTDHVDAPSDGTIEW